MYAKALQLVAEERLALDVVDSSTRMQITRIFGKQSPYTDLWLVSPCSYLEGKRPLDVLNVKPGEVIAAAVRKRNWENPG